RSKVAVTVVSAVRVTVQGSTPAQPPPCQPVKTEPGAGVGVSVTRLPLAYAAKQFAPQVIPVGALVTVPLPAPAPITVRVEFKPVRSPPPHPGTANARANPPLPP